MRLQNTFNALARWSTLLAFGLLPFLFIPISWITISQSKVTLMVILLFISALGWIVSRLAEGTVNVPARIVLVVGALLPFAYLVSVLVSGFTSLSLVGTGIEQDTLAAACIWFAALSLPVLIFSENSQRSIKALNALFVGGLVIAVLQVLHLFFPAALSMGGVLTGQTGNAFGSWHDFGILLGFFVFLGATLFSSSAIEGKVRYLYMAVVGLSLFLLVIVNPFDVWIALGTISFIFLLNRFLQERRLSAMSAIQQKSRKYLIIAVIILSVFFGAFGNFVTNVLPAPLKIANLEVRPSWRGTIMISRQVLVSPTTLLFGVGPNTFTQKWGLHKPLDINSTPFWNADFSTGVSSVPTSFITTGILGILAWVALLITLLWLTFKHVFRKNGSGSSSPLVEPIALSAVFLFAFYVLYTPGPALSIFSFLIFGLFIALAVSLGLIPSKTISFRENLIGRVVMLGVVAFGLIIALTGAGIGRALLSDTVLNHGIVTYNNTSDIEKSSALIASAIAISPQNDRAQRSAVELGLLQLQKLISTADPKDEKSKKQLEATLNDTIKHGLDAVSIKGSGYQNWLELASLYSQLVTISIEGAYDNARNAYSRARAENPNNPFPYLQLAQLELLQKKPDAALQYLSSSIQLKADFAPAFYLASLIYASKKDFKSATVAATQAVKSVPDDPLGWFNLGNMYYATADYANASQAFQQALVRQPQYSNAIYMLGLTYYKLNKTADAIKSFEDLDKLNPKQDAIQQILTNLRAGKAPIPQTQEPIGN